MKNKSICVLLDSGNKKGTVRQHNIGEHKDNRMALEANEHRLGRC